MRLSTLMEHPLPLGLWMDQQASTHVRSVETEALLEKCV